MPHLKMLRKLTFLAGNGTEMLRQSEWSEKILPMASDFLALKTTGFLKQNWLVKRGEIKEYEESLRKVEINKARCKKKIKLN